MLPRLYLIRHGETEWSLSGRHTGRTDIPLTARGEAESRMLRERLNGLAFNRVFTSPRRRARQTCELAGRGAGAEVEPDLAEWDYGDYEGLRSSEIHGRRPEWNIFHDGCPGGESPAQVSARADRLIRRLRALAGNIALFSHGHFGRVLAARWIGLPAGQGEHFQLKPAALGILAHEPDHAAEPVIVLWNAETNVLPGVLPALAEAESGPLTQPAIQRWENEGGEISPPDGQS